MRVLDARLIPVILAALLLCCASARATEPFSAMALAEHLYLVQGASGNTLVAVDHAGLILVEGVPAEQAGDYLAFVRELTGQQRIETLIHTHWHPDSAGLNASLAGKANIIVHANTRQWLGATIRRRGEEILHRPVPKEQLPDTIFHDRLSLPFRDGSIELGYLLQAHTDGDIYVHFPAQDVLYTGPVLRGDGWAAVDESSNGFVGGLVDAHEALATLITADTRIVPASGPPLDQAAFERQTAMYQALMAEMVALLRQSRSAEEVVIANPAAGLMPEWGDPSVFLDQGFRSFYGHLRNGRHVGTMP